MEDNECYNIKQIGFRREFLNKPGYTSTNSNISYNVKLTSYGQEYKKEDIYDNCRINFSISDCIKVVNLDFNIDTKETMANSLHKIRTIIDVCEDMIEDVKEARIRMLEDRVKIKTLKEQEK